MSYTAIPEVAIPLQETEKIDGGNNAGSFERTPRQHRALRILTGTTWISMLVFGLFASGHYVRRALNGTWSSPSIGWDLSDPNLYRPNSPRGNLLMVIHLIFGTILMVLGPIQLIPSVRRNYLNLHRLMGRLYIVSTITAATLHVFLCYCIEHHGWIYTKT